MSFDYFCPQCSSEDVEEYNNNLICGNCEAIFSQEDFRMFYKIANKALSLETGEMDINDIIDTSMNYIFEKGIIVVPNFEADIKAHLGVVPLGIILAKISSLECAAEDLPIN